ncbi:MAG: hypothetical protein Q8R90_09290 [Bacteroidales bacterium]|nr:hypothetical protein [Bacteroidales bacterium]
MKRVKQYIPIAVDVIEDLFISENPKIPDEYDNIVCQFGLSIRRLGVKSAVYALSQKYKKNKEAVCKAIVRIIQIHDKGICSKDDTLIEYVKANISNPLLKSKLMDASVALKLALRVFTEVDIMSKNMKD